VPDVEIRCHQGGGNPQQYPTRAFQQKL
jgi:hypothetical protein